jgi:glycine/D-amino acid oxidase-like deaminating enzyme
VFYVNGVVEGAKWMAQTTIVATGPWTPALLRSPNVNLPINLEGFFTVAACSVGSLPLHAEEYEKFKSMPILVTQQGVSNSTKK